MIVAELDVWDPAANAATTLYVSTQAWTSEPTDTPANTSFLERLLEAPSFRQDMFDAALTSGRSRTGIGSAVLTNADHGIDSWLDYYWNGRECRFYSGVGTEAYPGGWTLVFKGRMLPPDADGDTIRVNIRDAQKRMEVPLQTTRYAGDNDLPNGLEGTAADLKGKPKPICMGEVLNIAPPSVNTSKLIYQVHDGAVQSITVYDSGLVLSGSDPSFEEINAGLESEVYAIIYDEFREQFVIVGKKNWAAENYLAATSPDGSTWTVRSTPFGSNAGKWIDVDIDTDTGHLIAVGQSAAAAPLVITSPDGAVWEEQTSSHGSSDFLQAIAAGPGKGSGGGTRWVAGGYNGSVSTSDDSGESWTNRSFSTTYGSTVDVGPVRYGGGTWIAAIDHTDNSGGRIEVSADGINWSAVTIPWASQKRCYALAYSPTLTRWAAGSQTGQYAYSDDGGFSWTEVEITGIHNGSDVLDLTWAADIERFLMWVFPDSANDPSEFWVSADGITWNGPYTSGIPDGHQASLLPTGRKLAYHPEIGATVIVGRPWSTDQDPMVVRAGPFGLTYATEADLLDERQAPPAGGAGFYLAGGYFRLGSNPAGLVTADVVQGATDADKTAAQLFVDVAGLAGLTAGDWSAADVTEVDGINAAVLGYWSGLSEVSCAEVADQLMHSIGGWWGADELGVLRLGVLQDPTGTAPDHSIGVRDVDATATGTTLRRIRPRDVNEGVPWYEVVLGYAKNWSVQESGVVGAVTQARRERLARKHLDATFSDTAVQTAHPLSKVLRRDTLLADADAATDEVERLHRMLRYPAEAYEFATAWNAATAMRIGDVVRLTNDYYGLTSPGKRLVIIKREVRPSALPPVQLLTVWRPASTTRATPAGTSTVSASANLILGMAATAAGSGSVAEITGEAVEAGSSQATAAGTATTSADLQIMQFWGWDGTGSNGSINVDGWARSGGGQFSPGAGTYIVTHLTYNWAAATSADVRLALYTNSSLTIDGATLEYDHAVESGVSSGFQIYPIAGRVEITHNDYAFGVCKTNTATTLTIRVYTLGGKDDIDRRDGDQNQNVNPEETVAWDSTAPTWLAAHFTHGVAVGFYYVPA